MSYKHFNINDRLSIGFYLNNGYSINKISKKMLRSKSSISDEIKKYSLPIHGYVPVIAHSFAMDTRKSSKWISRLNPKLFQYIREKLLLTWSPEQIQHRLIIDYPNDKDMRTSFKNIYAMIYRGNFEEITKKNLRRKGKKVYYRKICKIGKIPDTTPMSERPESINKRENIGDWEIDTVRGKSGSKPCVGSFADRKTRYYIALKMDDAKAITFNKIAFQGFKKIAKNKINSLNADNGSEFAGHKLLSKKLHVKVYFANPRSPWERPTNENGNGLLREFFPKGIDFNTVSQKDLNKACYLINNRPRKCLKWLSSQEVFNKC